MKETLLFIEDTGEPMYKIDRILTQLSISGRLEQLSGLLIGCFDCGTETNVNIRLQEDIWNRVLELTANSPFPIWGNVPVGHLSTNYSLPVGMIAIQDSSSGTLLIDQNSNIVQIDLFQDVLKSYIQKFVAKSITK